MSASQPIRKPDDAPEVAALREKALGEPLTDADRALLAAATRKPARRGIAHADVEADLAERTRRGA